MFLMPPESNVSPNVENNVFNYETREDFVNYFLFHPQTSRINYSLLYMFY